MNSALPDSARLAWWTTAWLRGHEVPDLMIDAVIDTDATHAIAGLAALGLGGDGSTETLLAGLARLRVEGATSCGLAFPAEGDLVGLGGPAEFNRAALEAGEAVVFPGTDVGLVPVRVGAALTWVAYPAARRQLPDVGEADRELRRALVETAERLARLGVAAWRPEVADQLMNLRHRPVVVAPAGVPARCADLAARAIQALDIAHLALEDDGGAITAQEVADRRAALLPLERAGRRGLVAACSPEVWPPD